MGLPFLVVYGAMFWRIALGVLCVVVLGSIALVRWRQALTRTRRAMRELDRLDSEGVVRGTLGGTGAATLASTQTKPGANSEPVVVDQRVDEVWIETADGRVILDGAIRVIAGSRARRAGRQTVASITLGDAVIAHGRLERTPSTEPSTYRVERTTMRLHASEAAPISVVARNPRAVAPRQSLPFVLCVVGATALGGWKIAQQLGENWRESCQSPYERFAEPVVPNAPLAFTNSDACVLAAAMPGSRATALERIRDAIINQPYRDAGSLDRSVEIAMFVDGCSGALPLVMAADRYDVRLTLARRCGDRRTEHLALKSLGQFEEAAAIDVPAQNEGHVRSDGATLILAGRWMAAANAADARAKQIRMQAAKPDERAGLGLTALSYDCLAQYLRHIGGDASAEPKLRSLAGSADGTVCAPELAELASADERRVLLEAGHPRVLIDTDWILHAMAWLDGSRKGSWSLDDAESILSNPDDMRAALRASVVWLVATTPPLPAGASALQQVDRLRWAAVKATFDGNVEAAAVAANAAVAAATTLPDATLLRDLRHLPALVGLRTVATSLPVDLASDDDIVHKMWMHSFGRLLLRTGGSIEGAYFGPVREYVAALAQAEGGDGSALVHQIGDSDHQWWSDADIMAVLPRITRERDAIVRQVTWSPPYQASSIFDRNFPWSIALHAIARRDVLTLAGQPAEAARWNEIYRRFDAALRDRRKLIALMLWQIY